ncbi:N-6 DNA methylase [Acidithiobacillus ferrivorans]|nr:N-6 DNA methylase [Acidithiobacillus ferrivorans]
MFTELQTFVDTIREKFASHIVGGPEDHLRAPFEGLLIAAGHVVAGRRVTVVGETSLGDNGGRPDFGVAIEHLLCGYVELKAPGKGADVTSYSGHDRKQWERFSKLPNILYSDGREFALYRRGVQQKIVRLQWDPRSSIHQTVSENEAVQIASLFRDYLMWEPLVPSSAGQLAEFLAPLTRMLRDDVLYAMRSNIEVVQAAARDWRNYLFPGADDAHFSDAYAQTVTFTLLLARSNGSDTLFLDESIASLTHANSLLARALQVLTDPLVGAHLGVSLGLLQRVIAKVPTGTMSGGRRDPWLHFYEDFLAIYDPELRKDAGAYYTPVEVVQAQVRLVDSVLRHKMRKTRGFASGGVNVLDPAVGTGTYLLGIIEHALECIEREEGRGSVSARAALLGGNLYGFEIMVGPYAVASLRLTRMLHQFGAELPGDGVQIMLSNTLESPYENIPEFPLFYRPLGIEHRRAKRVKETVHVLVCIGNPPYDRHAAASIDNHAMTGGWVRWGESGNSNEAILADFVAPVRAAGKGAALKNLYNLYVYFWRWGLWKVFEQDLANGPGIVSFVTASSFLDGDAFLGMRQHMRQVCDEIWIIDLGGDNRGAMRDENVFAIQTPVAITIAVRYGGPTPAHAAQVHYARCSGTREEKLEFLSCVSSFDQLKFADCPSGWNDSFVPIEESAYLRWPRLTDLMPWQHSGSQFKRTWPIGQNHAVLSERWQSMLSSAPREEAFKETRDRKIAKSVTGLYGDERPSILSLPKDAALDSSLIVRYGYRSFDRQYAIADSRVGDFLRPALWHSLSQDQVFFAGLLTKVSGFGPTLTMTPYVPDMDYFSGRGAKDIIPLFRNADATVANLHPELLTQLETTTGLCVSPTGWAQYLYAVLAQPAFAELFQQELKNKEVRVPISRDPGILQEAIRLGKRLIFLHSFGERFGDDFPRISGVARCLRSVGESLPESFSYNEESQLLAVGDGVFGPVAPALWGFEVSGLKVLQSWLGYRKSSPRGKRSSSLDAIQPHRWDAELNEELLLLLWILEETMATYPKQAELLCRILSGGLLSESNFGPVPEALRKAPAVVLGQIDLL